MTSRKAPSPLSTGSKTETEARGWDYVFGMSAHAQPAGLTTRSTYESLRDELLERLQGCHAG